MDTIFSQLAAQVNTFTSIAIVGVAMSLVVNYIKGKFGMESGTTKGLTIVLSLVLGGVFYFLRDTALWQSVLGVLAAASTFWAIFLKK